MNELQDVRTLEVVAAEIRTLTASMLNGCLEIGRRMVEAKAMVPYGSFGEWVKENTGYSSSTANNFMRLFEEYGAAQSSIFGASAESQTIGKLSYTKALALLALPAEEREAFAEEVHAEELSTRELKEKIKLAEAQRDEAVRKAEDARKELADQLEEQQAVYDTDMSKAAEAKEKAERALLETKDEVASLRTQIRELEERPVEVAVQAADPKEIQAAVDKAMAAKDEELRKLEARLEKEKKKAEGLQKEKAILEQEQKEAKESAEEDVSAAAEEVAELKKQLAMSGGKMVAFRLRFEEWQKAWRAMQDALRELEPEEQEKMRRAVQAQVEGWRE